MEGQQGRQVRVESDQETLLIDELYWTQMWICQISAEPFVEPFVKLFVVVPIVSCQTDGLHSRHGYQESSVPARLLLEATDEQTT